MNSIIANLRESATLAVANEVRKRIATGEDVIQLQTGDPDFDTHPLVVEEALRAMKEGQTHYVHTRGLMPYREAVAQRWKLRYGVRYDPEKSILATHGGIHGLLVTLQALIESGDEVLIETPRWMPYEACTKLAGGVPVYFGRNHQNVSKFSVSSLFDAITDRSKVIIINSPCNPSGRMLSETDWAQIAKIADKHNLVVVSDEVYESIVFDGRRHIAGASISGLDERCITIGSMSKSHAMSGWRIGFVAAPEKYINVISKVCQYSITSLSPFVQHAAVRALTDPVVAQYEKEMSATYESRRNELLKFCSAFPSFSINRPHGAFYFLLKYNKKLGACSKVATELLQQVGVAVVPGTGFGPDMDGYLRITFSTDIEYVKQGFMRIQTWMQQRT